MENGPMTPVLAIDLAATFWPSIIRFHWPNLLRFGWPNDERFRHPLAKLGALFRIYTVSDSNYYIQIVMYSIPFYQAHTFLLNCSEFPNS